MSDQHAIETMLLEERRYPPPEEFAAQANAKPDIYDEPFEAFGAYGAPRSASRGSSRSRSCTSSGSRRTRSGISAAS